MIREYLNKFAKKIVHRNLKKISNGQLLITESNNIYKFGTQSVLKAEIKVTNPSFYTEILLGGSIGASEAYIHKSWTSKDVTKVIQLMARNQSTMDSIEGPFRILTAPLLRILHALNRNTLYGSKKNIAQHYDLSNKFFSLFLDPSMMYSSAI